MLAASFLTLLLRVALASQISLLFESLNPGLVDRLEDVSYEMLQNHSIILLPAENSILTSQLRFHHSEAEGLGTNGSYPQSDLTNLFVHTEYLPDLVNSQKKDTVNIRGCFDNRHSSTTSTVAQTYGNNVFFSAGPRFGVLFLGLEVGLLATVAYDATREEKLTCLVGPGERLQLQMATTTTKLKLKRQRILKLEAEQKYTVSPWRDLEELHVLKFTSSVMTCATNETYLQC